MKRSGFTLLEVLLVLVILMTGLASLSTLVRSSMQQSIEAEEKTSIQLECQNRMNQILAGTLIPFPGQEDALPGYEDWLISVSYDPTILRDIVRIRIRAQKYEFHQVRTENSHHVTSIPVGGQEVVLARWVRAASIPALRKTGGGSSVIGSLQNPPSAGQGGSEFPEDAFIEMGTSDPIDPFAQGGFSPMEDWSESTQPYEEEVPLHGDPLSHSLLERARERQEGNR